MWLKKLTKSIKGTGGRNAGGRITSYHRGGGHKKRYRYLDWKRSIEGVVGVVKTIEYDPNRTGRIGLIGYSNGLIGYSLLPEGIEEGSLIKTETRSGELEGVNREGSVIALKDGKVGDLFCNVELVAGKGGQLARAAGSYVRWVKEYAGINKVLVKLRSGEYRILDGECKGMIGVVSNIGHSEEEVGKAGKSRWLGRRPVVRGVAMNPIDHPHGGGEGKTSGSAKTPWGKVTLGAKTRKKSKVNKNRIIKR